MIENEFKIMLTKEQYNNIHSLFEWDDEFSQTNTYYDTPDLQMSDRHITVRVREIAGDFFLQMKLPAETTNNGAVSRIELESHMDNIPQSISGELLSETSKISDLPDVSLLGELSTIRSKKLYPSVEIDLDKSTYFGKTDYELEVEYTDEAAASEIVSRIRSQAGLNMFAPSRGKIRRFLAEYILRCEEQF